MQTIHQNNNSQIINPAPLISVIVPVYNVERSLEKCLNSIVEQTFKNFELICVNDGATDSSRAILESFLTKEPRLIIIDKPNGGLSSARNEGLKHANGKFIVFIDSDDWIAPSTFEKAVKHINEDTGMVFWGAEVVLAPYETEKPPHFDITVMSHRRKYAGYKKLNERLSATTPVTAWNKLFRADIIKKHNIIFPQGLLYEDNAFWWQYILWIKSIYYIDENLYFYTQSRGSIMSRLFEKKVFSLDGTKVADFIFDYYKSAGMEKRYEKRLVSVFSKLFMADYNCSPSQYEKEICAYGKKVLEKWNMKHNNLLTKALLTGAPVPADYHTGLAQKLFSVTNSGNRKIIRLLFMRFEFNRKHKSKPR